MVAVLWNSQSLKDSDNFHTMIVGCFYYVFLNLTETGRRKNIFDLTHDLSTDSNKIPRVSRTTGYAPIYFAYFRDTFGIAITVPSRREVETIYCTAARQNLLLQRVTIIASRAHMHRPIDTRRVEPSCPMYLAKLYAVPCSQFFSNLRYIYNKYKYIYI